MSWFESKKKKGGRSFLGYCGLCIIYNNVAMVFFPWVWGKELLFLEMVILFGEVWDF